MISLFLLFCILFEIIRFTILRKFDYNVRIILKQKTNDSKKLTGKQNNIKPAYVSDDDISIL